MGSAGGPGFEKAPAAPAPLAGVSTPKPAPAPATQAPAPVAQAPAPASVADAPTPEPAPAPTVEARVAAEPVPQMPTSVTAAPTARVAQEPVPEFAPESIAQLTGAWAHSRADCDELFQQRGKALAYRQPVDKFAQAAIVEAHRIRLPSATCQIDRAPSDSGALGICNVKRPSGYVLPATEPSRMQTAADVTESGKHDLQA
jgi:hypothetical protein